MATTDGRRQAPRPCPGTETCQNVPRPAVFAGRGTFLGAGVPGSADVRRSLACPGAAALRRPGWSGVGQSLRHAQRSGYVAEFGVERFAIGGDEGRAEELIDADAFAAAFFEGAAADGPAVEVEGGQAVAEDAGADGVEAAGDGFDESAAAGAVGPFDGAETIISFETRVGTFLAAVEEGRHQVAVGIYFEEAGLFDPLTAFHAHPSFVSRVVALKQFRFTFQQGRAAVTDDAAGAAARFVVAAEVLRKHFGGDQNVSDLENGRDVHRKKLCKFRQLLIILAAFMHSTRFGNKNQKPINDEKDFFNGHGCPLHDGHRRGAGFGKSH